jgi:AcrR family transcriptional regulator
MPDAPPLPVTAPVPRGRHAPPPEVRAVVQRGRLFAAAGAVFARVGYADASAEAISREAGMSKATFYEHFSNKEECILALFDHAADYVLREMGRELGSPEDVGSYEEWIARSLSAFLGILAAHPDAAQTLLVEIIGAGPQAVARRDSIMDHFSALLVRDNARTAPRFGHPRFASRDDAYACIGAIFELVSRQLRTGRPSDISREAARG